MPWCQSNDLWTFRLCNQFVALFTWVGVPDTPARIGHRPTTPKTLAESLALCVLRTCVGYLLFQAILPVYPWDTAQAHVLQLRNQYRVLFRRLTVLGLLIWRTTHRRLWLRVGLLVFWVFAASAFNSWKFRQDVILIDLLCQWPRKGQQLQVVLFLALRLSPNVIETTQNALWLPIGYHWDVPRHRSQCQIP
ncbi:hypothetical protein F4679DRAFT_595034 [Xylaria curta]|nr:hypothetical protein F4679DRAFT_595034 [Xylaria curta]